MHVFLIRSFPCRLDLCRNCHCILTSPLILTLILTLILALILVSKDYIVGEDREDYVLRLLLYSLKCCRIWHWSKTEALFPSMSSTLSFLVCLREEGIMIGSYYSASSEQEEVGLLSFDHWLRRTTSKVSRICLTFHSHFCLLFWPHFLFDSEFCVESKCGMKLEQGLVCLTRKVFRPKPSFIT